MPRRAAAIGDVLAGLALIALAWYVIDAAGPFRGDGWLLPTVLAWLIGFGGVLLVAKAALRRFVAGRGGAAPTEEAAPGDEGTLRSTAALLMSFTLVGLSIVYVWVIPRLGFYLASTLYMPVLLYLLGMRRPWVHLVTVCGFLLFVFLVFERSFLIPLPRGAWLRGLW